LSKVLNFIVQLIKCDTLFNSLFVQALPKTCH